MKLLSKSFNGFLGRQNEKRISEESREKKPFLQKSKSNPNIHSFVPTNDFAKFNNWFGNSVVMKKNKPLVCFHGGYEGISEFNPDISVDGRTGRTGLGTYFTCRETLASEYVKDYGQEAVKVEDGYYYDFVFRKYVYTKTALYPVYLRMENPYYMPTQEMLNLRSYEEAKQSRKELEELGYDGVILDSKRNGYEYIIFKPNQIKSARFNNMEFNNDSNSIYEHNYIKRHKNYLKKEKLMIKESKMEIGSKILIKETNEEKVIENIIDLNGTKAIDVGDKDYYGIDEVSFVEGSEKVIKEMIENKIIYNDLSGELSIYLNGKKYEFFGSDSSYDFFKELVSYISKNSIISDNTLSTTGYNYEVIVNSMGSKELDSIINDYSDLIKDVSFSEKVKEAFDVKKVIGDMAKSFDVKSDEGKGKVASLFKGIIFNDSDLANEFMAEVDKATTKIANKLLKKKESIEESFMDDNEREIRGLAIKANELDELLSDMKDGLASLSYKAQKQGNFELQTAIDNVYKAYPEMFSLATKQMKMEKLMNESIEIKETIKESKFTQVKDSGLVQRLMKEFKLSLEDFDSYQSDLYIRATPGVKEYISMLDKTMGKNITSFYSEGNQWLELPFALMD